MKRIEEFGVFVLSNASLTHILFGDSRRTPCGLENEGFGERRIKHPHSEVRDVMPTNKFKEWIEINRGIYSDMRLCIRCLSAFDKWYNSQN